MDEDLAKIARIALQLPVTQVSVENLFSSLKYVLNDLRMRFGDDTNRPLTSFAHQQASHIAIRILMIQLKKMIMTPKIPLRRTLRSHSPQPPCTRHKGQMQSFIMKIKAKKKQSVYFTENSRYRS